MEQHQSVVALAGGVGGAKLAQGLAGVVPGSQLTIIGNTADDFELWGLHISPDLDTVMYTLAGIANPVTGWGVVDDTHATLEAIGRYGVDTWFSLGDRDFATHILRTQRLREGQPLSTITADLASALGVSTRLLPMTDQPVATMVRSGDELLDFQDYFVARRQQDTVDGVVFRGIEQATPGPGVLDAIAGADVIVFCPSNPIVSIGPILAVPGLRDAVLASRAVKVGVSPIVGGRALKGPADRMLTSLGHKSSALGVARIYRDLLDVLVIDEIDRDLAPQVTNLGLQAAVAQTIMGDRQDRERLAAEVLAAAATERVGA
jgi:LPPG:FO 2-phospho-L-lactate transferase